MSLAVLRNGSAGQSFHPAVAIPGHGRDWNTPFTFWEMRLGTCPPLPVVTADQLAYSGRAEAHVSWSQWSHKGRSGRICFKVAHVQAGIGGIGASILLVDPSCPLATCSNGHLHRELLRSQRSKSHTLPSTGIPTRAYIASKLGKMRPWTCDAHHSAEYTTAAAATGLYCWAGSLL